MDESWLAPAKLNLFLHITGRRSDGYHNLQTLFQLLDWGDELRFSVSNSGGISRSCNIDGIPEAEDICVRAAHLLKTRLGIQKGVHIDLTKQIPMGAGLGGVFCAAHRGHWSRLAGARRTAPVTHVH